LRASRKRTGKKFRGPGSVRAQVLEVETKTNFYGMVANMMQGVKLAIASRKEG
jgi:hypothetical protein